MSKFIVLCIFGAVFVLAQEQQRGPGGEGNEGTFGDQENVPGISDQSNQNLHDRMKNKPEAGQQNIDSWRDGLTDNEKTAADSYFSQRHHRHTTPSTM